MPARMPRWAAAWWGAARDLWRRARTEHATPREIALATGMGAFVGCTPLIGLHIWIALGLATLLRLNRLFSVLGSRVSNTLFLPWIVLAEIQLAHRVRTGAFAPLTAREAIDHAPGLLADWCLGSVPVGAALALVVGAVAYGLARIRDARRRTPAEPPRRSSGSPP